MAIFRPIKKNIKVQEKEYSVYLLLSKTAQTGCHAQPASGAVGTGVPSSE